VDQFLQPLGHITNKHPATISRNPNKVVRQPIDCMCTSSGLHRDGDYSIARSSSTLCGPYTGHTCQRTAVPTHGGRLSSPPRAAGFPAGGFREKVIQMGTSHSPFLSAPKELVAHLLSL
jgi:hypothetical protein